MRKELSRRALYLLLAAVIVSVSACAKNDEAVKKDSTAARSLAVAPPIGGPPATEDDYAAMTGKWADHLKLVKFDSTLMADALTRECDGKETVDECPLHFVPAADTHLFSQKGAETSAKGFVLGIIHSYKQGATKTETKFNIEPGHHVLWVVSGKTSHLLDMERNFTEVYSGPFTNCHPDNTTAPTSSAAGFYYCSVSPYRMANGLYGPALSRDSINRLLALEVKQGGKSRHEHTSPPWVSCAEGCCNVDGT